MHKDTGAFRRILSWISGNTHLTKCKPPNVTVWEVLCRPDVMAVLESEGVELDQADDVLREVAGQISIRTFTGVAIILQYVRFISDFSIYIFSLFEEFIRQSE